MTFIEPSLERVFQTLVDNDELINHLKSQDYLITKSSLYDNYTKEQVKDMEIAIYSNNVNTLYELAQVLLNFSDKIKNNQIWYLVSHKVAWEEISACIGVEPKNLNVETYKLLMYTYKYCVISSFFQNNKGRFMPEADFLEIENNGVGSAFYDAMAKEFDKLNEMINKCLEYRDFDTIPYDLINYLTQLLGFEKKDINADTETEAKFRELAKNILDIYRIKGTNYSFELFFNFLGFNIKISEYYFDRRLFYTTSNAGNEETESSNNAEFEYYLTTVNPADNKLQKLGISEIVSPSDITPQYSLLEFNKLCQEYGPEAVLGYSPIYPVYNSNGDLMEYKKYEGKVYKYFKTNVIYYTIGVDMKNPTEKQLTAVTKYLEFLTPSYVMRTIKVDTYSEKTEEPIGFDGDGSETPDAYGNFNSFQMLDSEDWSQHFKDEYVTGSTSGVAKKVNENNYLGKEETFDTYVNSVGTNKFRLPLGRKTISKSVSRYLHGGDGVNKPNIRRLKFYILHTLDGVETDDWGSQNVIIAPYYTVPPFVGAENYTTIKNSWDKPTKLINLTGGDGEGGEECLKTQIRDADLRTAINYVTNKTIDEFIKEPEFNELKFGETFPKKLVKVRTIPYGTGKYKSAYEAYLWELNQNKTHICNISCSIDTFEKEVLQNEETDSKSSFNSEIYTDAQIANYNKNDILKNLNFGDYVLSYSGDLNNGKLNLYRYGYTPYPIIGDSNQYAATYLNYLNSFEYELRKDYNGSLSNFESVNLQAGYITKQSLLEAQQYVNQLRAGMIEAANKKQQSEWLPIDYITSKLFYIAADGEYYRAVKVPAYNGISNDTYQNGRNHNFSTLQEAINYFNDNPAEKVNNAEFYVNSTTDKGLYTFKYKNRISGCLIYSTADEKLYYVTGASRQDIKIIENWFGNLTINSYVEDPNGDFYEDSNGLMNKYTDGVNASKRYSISDNGNIIKGEINKYDYFWKGYDELADEEDFIFYNAEHKITWPELNIKNEIIARPIKRETDLQFDEDTGKHLLTYNSISSNSANVDLDNVKDKFKLVSGIPTYYNTFGQRIIDEISTKTIDNFTANEHVDWYKEDLENGHVRGLLSIIENAMKELTNSPLTREFVFYSKTSDFFQDYYRIIVLGTYTKESIPKEILERLTGKIYSEIEDVDITEAIKNKITTYYNLAVNQCADRLDSISKDRVYYSFIENWRNAIEIKLTDWNEKGTLVLDKDGKIDDAAMFKDPLSLTNEYGANNNKQIAGKFYFDERTAFIAKVKAAITDLKNKYGDNINFDFSTKERKSLLGKDAYSLTVGSSPKFFEVPSNFSYSYKTYKDIKTLTISDGITLSYDSIYNFYIPYSLNYGLGVYSKDFYGEQRDIYSEFTEMFDLLHGFSKGTTSKEEINNFLKQYYYKKLTNLFRESSIKDEEPLSIETQGKKPTKIYPKLTEKLDGRGGFFGSPWTLLSTFVNNGKYYGNAKLNFYKIDVKLSDNYKKAVIKFFVKKEDFVKCFGYDFNRYYKMLDLSKVNSSEEVAKLSQTIEEMYKKQFACIKPIFQFRQNIYDISRPSNWQAARKYYETDFASAEVKNTDSNYLPITNDSGYVIGKNGLRLNTSEEIRARLKESSEIIITITDTSITTGLRLTAEKEFFKDMNVDEQSNIFGYLIVKKLTQKFIDNYISKCYSAEWIEKNSEGEPTEYNSFGDDRSINVISTNKAVTIDNYENYYKSLKIYDKVHDEEVAQFNEQGRVLTNNGYVQFNKFKTFEDQGLKPIYKNVPENKVYLSHIDNNTVSVATFTDNEEEQKIINDDIKVYYNSYGKLCVEIPSSRMHVGNITKIRLFFKSLYIKVSTRILLSYANFEMNSVFIAAKALTNSIFAKIHQTSSLFTSAKAFAHKIASTYNTNTIFAIGAKTKKVFIKAVANFTNKTFYTLLKCLGYEIKAKGTISNIMYYGVSIIKHSIISKFIIALKKNFTGTFIKTNKLFSNSSIFSPSKYTNVNILEKIILKTVKAIKNAINLLLVLKSKDLENSLDIRLITEYINTSYYRPEGERDFLTTYRQLFTNADITTTDYKTFEFDYLTSSAKANLTQYKDTDNNPETPDELVPGFTIYIPWYNFEFSENGNNFLYPDPAAAGSWKRLWESPRQNFWFIENQDFKVFENGINLRFYTFIRLKGHWYDGRLWRVITTRITNNIKLFSKVSTNSIKIKAISKFSKSKKLFSNSSTNSVGVNTNSKISEKIIPENDFLFSVSTPEQRYYKYWLVSATKLDTAADKGYDISGYDGPKSIAVVNRPCLLIENNVNKILA